MNDKYLFVVNISLHDLSLEGQIISNWIDEPTASRTENKTKDIHVCSPLHIY